MKMKIRGLIWRLFPKLREAGPLVKQEHTALGPDRNHIWQPWSCRWRSLAERWKNGPGSKMFDFYLKLFNRCIRLVVCRVLLRFSSLKWSKNLPVLCKVCSIKAESIQSKEHRSWATACNEGHYNILLAFHLFQVGLLSSECSITFHPQNFYSSC